jgi:uncharacterized alpha-E superfamily protein
MQTKTVSNTVPPATLARHAPTSGPGTTVLLCRTAYSLYWAGRYLERAESLARLVAEHTALLVDLPTSVPLTWEPLLAIPGVNHGFYAQFERADEPSIMQFLLADPSNPSSLYRSLTDARENLRTVRQVFPPEAWRLANELAAFVETQAATGWRRGRRHRLLDRVIADCQRLAGVVSGAMRRDHAYEFFAIGTQLERADMTTRVLDVRAASLIESDGDGPASLFDEVQWLGVMRSLVGLYAFRRSTSHRVLGPEVARFLLSDPYFPRSVVFCLDGVADALSRLPVRDGPAEACARIRRRLAAVATTNWTKDTIRRMADDLQLGLIAVDTAVCDAYFESIS